MLFEEHPNIMKDKSTSVIYFAMVNPLVKQEMVLQLHPQ